MLALVALAGIGNSVFHPADYAILSASVERAWLGRAFSIHTFTGNLGFMLAPAGMIALTALLGWRGALSAAGVLAFVVLGAMLAWGERPARRQPGAPIDRRRSPIGRARARLPALGAGPAAVPVLRAHRHVHVRRAQLLGDRAERPVGHRPRARQRDPLGLPDRERRWHPARRADRRPHRSLRALDRGGVRRGRGADAGAGLVPLPALAIAALFVAIGLLQGSARTSRDMLVRRVTPPGARAACSPS